MNILVTGGAGFVGSHLVDRLLKENHEVTVLDLWESQDIIKHNDNPLYNFVKGSILDDNILPSIAKGKDRIVHMAAILGISESITTYDVEQVALVNVIGTIRILKAARKFSVSRVVLPISPDVSWLNPYTITKQTTEKFSKFFNKEYDIETVSLKFGKIYGPRERCLNFSMGSPFNYQFLIPTILIETLRGHTVQIYGDGNQKSEYIFIHDVIESFVRTLKIDKNLGGEVIPVGGNKNYSVNDIIETIEKCWDRKIEREYIKMRLGETPTEILLDNKKLKDVLDYELKWDLTKGLKETIPYYEQAFKNSSS
jgi:UDP-glucose 4-epimerase